MDEKPDEKKKPMKRSNSFSRRNNRGKKADDTGGGCGGLSSAAVSTTVASTVRADAAADDGYAEQAEVAAKPEFKLEEQADPVRDVVQREAQALFAAGAYDDAGEKFYYLAEAARNGGDKAQECTALQNMGTSLAFCGNVFEASRCYEAALHAATESTGPSTACKALRPSCVPHPILSTHTRPRRPTTVSSIALVCSAPPPLPLKQTAGRWSARRRSSRALYGPTVS